MAKNGGFKPDIAALVLAEADFFGDEQAAKRNGYSRKSVHNWKKRLETDENFSQLYLQKRQEFAKRWGEKLAPALQAHIDYLEAAARSNHADKKFDRETVHAMAGSTKILAEISLTKTVIEAGTQ